MINGVERLLMIYCDSKSDFMIPKHNKNLMKSNHIDIKFLEVT